MFSTSCCVYALKAAYVHGLALSTRTLGTVFGALEGDERDDVMRFGSSVEVGPEILSLCANMVNVYGMPVAMSCIAVAPSCGTCSTTYLYTCIPFHLWRVR